MNLIRRFVKKLVVTLLLNQFCEIEVSARGGWVFNNQRWGLMWSENSHRPHATGFQSSAGASSSSLGIREKGTRRKIGPCARRKPVNSPDSLVTE